MGLFRRSTKKNREKAAADLIVEHATTAAAPVEVALPHVTAEERPDPVEVAPPHVTAEQRPDPVEAARPQVTAEQRPDPVEAARPQVTAEQRPDPDQPGWGMTIGQQLGKSREDRPG
jgi:hypothetical protein